jgi:hypothetical protein
MGGLASLPSLPGISQSTGTDYSGLDEAGVDAALNAPLTSAETNQAMGYNYSAIPATPSLTPAIPSTGTSTPVATPVATTATATAKGSVFSTVLGLIESNVENVIFVLLGLMLIGAGIFSFKGTQSVVSTAAKYGSKAAEVAAA